MTYYTPTKPTTVTMYCDTAGTLHHSYSAAEIANVREDIRGTVSKPYDDYIVAEMQEETLRVIDEYSHLITHYYKLTASEGITEEKS